MSAKQALLEYIETLSEDDAISVWQRIQGGNDPDSYDRGPLTPAEIDEIREGLADIAAGRVYTLEEVERELGLGAREEERSRQPFATIAL